MDRLTVDLSRVRATSPLTRGALPPVRPSVPGRPSVHHDDGRRSHDDGARHDVSGRSGDVSGPGGDDTPGAGDGKTSEQEHQGHEVTRGDCCFGFHRMSSLTSVETAGRAVTFTEVTSPLPGVEWSRGWS